MSRRVRFPATRERNRTLPEREAEYRARSETSAAVNQTSPSGPQASPCTEANGFESVVFRPARSTIATDPPSSVRRDGRRRPRDLRRARRAGRRSIRSSSTTPCRWDTRAGFRHAPPERRRDPFHPAPESAHSTSSRTSRGAPPAMETRASVPLRGTLPRRGGTRRPRRGSRLRGPRHPRDRRDAIPGSRVGRRRSLPDCRPRPRSTRRWFRPGQSARRKGSRRGGRCRLAEGRRRAVPRLPTCQVSRYADDESRRDSRR